MPLRPKPPKTLDAMPAVVLPKQSFNVLHAHGPVVASSLQPRMLITAGKTELTAWISEDEHWIAVAHWAGNVYTAESASEIMDAAREWLNILRKRSWK